MILEPHFRLGEEHDPFLPSAEMARRYVNAGSAIPDDDLAKRYAAEVKRKRSPQLAVFDARAMVVEDAEPYLVVHRREALALPCVILILRQGVGMNAVAVAESTRLVRCAGLVHAAPIAARNQAHVVGRASDRDIDLAERRQNLKAVAEQQATIADDDLFADWRHQYDLGGTNRQMVRVSSAPATEHQ